MGTSAAHPNSKTLPLAAVAELGDEAMALARPDLHPREVGAPLLAKALFPAFPPFLAHAPPPHAKPSGGLGSRPAAPPATLPRQRSKPRSTPPKSGSRSPPTNSAAAPW